jgi:hypothetical protein
LSVFPGIAGGSEWFLKKACNPNCYGQSKKGLFFYSLSDIFQAGAHTVKLIVGQAIVILQLSARPAFIHSLRERFLFHVSILSSAVMNSLSIGASGVGL